MERPPPPIAIDVTPPGPHRAPGPLVSVVVPLAPGETEHHGLAGSLALLDGRFEVIFVSVQGDAADVPAGRLVESPAGRARQLNRGAAEAGGVWLWFLHADSRFGAEAVSALLAFTGRGAPALGWFHLRFRGDGPLLAGLNAWGANLRSRWLGLPFGDQGFILPARSFALLGRYDEAAPYGEDHLLAWAAHRAGLPVVPVGARLRTSARKYGRHGWMRTTWTHWRLTVLQAMGQWRKREGRA